MLLWFNCKHSNRKITMYVCVFFDRNISGDTQGIFLSQNSDFLRHQKGEEHTRTKQMSHMKPKTHEQNQSYNCCLITSKRDSLLWSSQPFCQKRIDLQKWGREYTLLSISFVCHKCRKSTECIQLAYLTEEAK